MRSAIRTISWAVLFAALGAAAASWFTPTPQLGADDAASVALDALEEAGVEGELVRTPRRDVHETESGAEIDAWIVRVLADDGDDGAEIELRVQESAGRLVYVDDRIGDDRSRQLLTAQQFAALGEHRDDTLADRWTLRNVLAVVAALFVAGTAYFLASRSDPLWSTRDQHR